MTKIRKKHGSNFKFKVALEALKGKKTVAELCQDYGVVSSQIYTWKQQLEDGAQSIFEENRKEDSQAEIDKLHRIIGKITAERDFLERVLKK